MDAAKSWMLAVVVLQKLDGTWKIINEHLSLPIECDEVKPAQTFDETFQSSRRIHSTTGVWQDNSVSGLALILAGASGLFQPIQPRKPVLDRHGAAA